MKKALVLEGQNRIFQIEAQAFEVAPPLKWVDVADAVTVDGHEYRGGKVQAKPSKSAAELQAIETEKAKAALLEIDLASVRALREWVAAQPTAPKVIKDRETAAVLERAKIK